GSLLRNGFELTVRDLDVGVAQPLLSLGAKWADSPAVVAGESDLVITCLPSPAISAGVMEAADGVLVGLSAGKIWVEMSTSDEREVRRLGDKVRSLGGAPMDCPVSGGCHRAATGNISIFAGGERETFERVLPVLAAMGRQILHTGPLGSASVLKVVTNYLASVHLVALGEAMMTAKKSGLDLATTYEGIRISSGNSFVHETESQVILNGSRNINFTMDLVVKDMGLFQDLADQAAIPLEVSPRVLQLFRQAKSRLGERAWSPNIVMALEEVCGERLWAPGFPSEIVDNEPESVGREVRVSGSAQ
ncbi:MAG: NAD(P)-dependent oxidoreductase, partial [Arenicellales bacterium]|nr:NAD(P)-dependent oxidoreductase [Arenicellales bacterium]